MHVSIHTHTTQPSHADEPNRPTIDRSHRPPPPHTQTPTNKPKSATTIYAWEGWAAVKALFGEAALSKTQSVSYWSFYQGVTKLGEGEGEVVGMGTCLRACLNCNLV